MDNWIPASEAAKRGLQMALDEAMVALDELLADDPEDDTMIVHQSARVVRLEQMLKGLL